MQDLRVSAVEHPPDVNNCPTLTKLLIETDPSSGCLNPWSPSSLLCAATTYAHHRLHPPPRYTNNRLLGETGLDCITCRVRSRALRRLLVSPLSPEHQSPSSNSNPRHSQYPSSHGPCIVPTDPANSFCQHCAYHLFFWPGFGY